MFIARPNLLLKSFTVVCLFTSPLVGQGAVIDTDMIIDAASPLNGESITVVDGVNGPSTVQIVDGGIVPGIKLQDASSVTLSGGEITSLVNITGQSRLSISEGRISCSDLSCRSIDFDSLVTARQSAAIELHGGQIDGAIRLHDESTLTVFGTTLQLTMFAGDWFVEGVLSDGSVVSQGVRLFGDPNGRIFFVPEPTASLIASIAALSLATILHHRHTFRNET